MKLLPTGAVFFGASLFFGCIAFPQYPVSTERAHLRPVPSLGGNAHVTVSISRHLDGERNYSKEEYEWIWYFAKAYQDTEVFDSYDLESEDPAYFVEAHLDQDFRFNDVWMIVSLISFLTIPVYGETLLELHTRILDGEAGNLIGESRVSYRLDHLAHVLVAPLMVTNFEKWAEERAVFGLARRGLIAAADSATSQPREPPPIPR